MSTTNVRAIRTAIAQRIARIIPRNAQHREMRWTWVERDAGRDVRGPSRSFDLVPGIAEETLEGYGDGLQYAVELRLRATYDRLTDVEFGELASDDIADLAVMLVTAHEDVAGLIPFETNASKQEPIVRAEVDPDSTETRRMVEFIFRANFYASDTVQLEEP
jgi:hypothetical protein